MTIDTAEPMADSLQPAEAGTSVPILTRSKTGRAAPGPRIHFPTWSPEEEVVFRRHLDALLQGDYFLVRDAAVPCLAELKQLPGGSSRRLSAIHNRLSVQAAAVGRRAYCASWSEQEETNVRRYAVALVSGKYGSTREAVDDCLRRHELLRHERPGAFAPRTRFAIWLRFMKAARHLGWTGRRRHALGKAKETDAAKPVEHERGCGRGAPWNREERAVAERYARELAEGRYSGNCEAGRKCLAELRRLPVHHLHSLSAVTTRVAAIAASSDIPRARAHWTTDEKGIIERYACAVLAGKYAGPAQATEDCYRDFCRLVALHRQKGGGLLGDNVGRTRQAVQYQLVKRVRALGRHGQPLVRWSQSERRICESWVRWFTKHCVPGRRHPMDVASEGLRDELAEAGFSRSLSGCQHRLRKLRLRRMGVT